MVAQGFDSALLGSSTQAAVPCSPLKPSWGGGVLATPPPPEAWPPWPPALRLFCGPRSGQEGTWAPLLRLAGSERFLNPSLASPAARSGSSHSLGAAKPGSPRAAGHDASSESRPPREPGSRLTETKPQF